MRQKIILLAVLIQITAGAYSLRAGITPITNPFTGDALESYEEFSFGDQNSPLTIFGGKATISGPYAYIWQTETTLGAAGGIGIGPFDARAFDGDHG